MALQDYNTVDPFSQIYTALRTAILADSVLNGVFQNPRKPINVNDLDDMNRLKFKAGLTTADKPQLEILQSRFTLKPFGSNSSSSDFSQSYPIIASFDGYTATQVNVFKWRLMCVLFQMGQASPGQAGDGYLGLRGLVRVFDITESQDDVFGLTAKAAPAGWTAILSINVYGSIDRRALAAA